MFLSAEFLIYYTISCGKGISLWNSKENRRCWRSILTRCYARAGLVTATELSHDRLILSDALMVLTLNRQLIPGKLTKVELKTDTYSFNRSKNFFIEAISNEGAQTLGGPWRAVKDGIKYYVYLYQSAGVFYWFDAATLKRKMQVLIEAHGLTTVRVLNQKRYGGSYYTLGFDILPGVNAEDSEVASVFRH